MQVPFGKDQYYYGYYIVNYFTKEGSASVTSASTRASKGRRTVSINFYRMNDRLEGRRHVQRRRCKSKKTFRSTCAAISSSAINRTTAR